MELTANEKHRLKIKMLFYKYESFQTAFFETLEYQKLREVMLSNLLTKKDKRLKYLFCDKNELLSAGKYVIEKHMDDIDLRIPYTNGDDLSTQLMARFGPYIKEEQYNQVIDYVKNHVELRNVTDIPLNIDVDKSKNGHVLSTWFYGSKNLKDAFFENMPVCTNEISVFGSCDDMAKTIYVHEMTHALINRHKGNVLNLLYSEALPIFMERVAALDLDDSGELLLLTKLRRILNIKQDIIDKINQDYNEESAFDTIVDETYIVSSLLATALFETYEKGSLSLKKEINNHVNDVLMGDAVLEDVFDHYEASLENGAKIMSKQVKKLSKF